jgi:glycosyltransferase involved in cell wall biosynthesis
MDIAPAPDGIRFMGSRCAGDLIYSANGAEVRDAIRQADKQMIPEARSVYANSINVARRLKEFCGIEAVPLYHPPPRAALLFGLSFRLSVFPSRLAQPKRQALVLSALAKTKQKVRVHFAGTADKPPYAAELESQAEKLGVASRVEWLGLISEDENCVNMPTRAASCFRRLMKIMAM